MGPHNRRRLWGSTAVLLMIAAWMILQWPERGLWYDETVNAYFAEHPWAELWEWCTRIDNQMPLHFALLKLWGMTAGTGEFALRFFSVACALLSVAGVVALGRRLGASAWAGWLAALALALSQSFLYAAFEVRPYALLVALLGWSSVVLCEWWERYGVRERSRDRTYWTLLAAYALLSVGLIYTHYTAIFALAAHGAFAAVWTIARRSRYGLYNTILLVAAPIIGLIPWLLALAGRDVRAGTAYDDQVTPGQAVQTYVDFYAHGQRFVPEGAAPYGWAIVIVLLGALGLWLVRRRRAGVAPVRGIVFALCMVVVPLVSLLVMVFAVQAKLSGRHGWMIWLGVALLLGIGLAAIQRMRGMRWLVWAGALGIVWLPANAGYQPLYNSYLREAFDYINTHARPGDVLVLRDGTLFTAADYYDAALPWIGLPPEKLTDVNRPLFFDEAVASLDRLVSAQGASRVWVLSWQGDVMDPQNVIAGLLEAVGQPEPLAGAFGFGDVTVTLSRLEVRPEELRAQVDALDIYAQVPLDGPVYVGGYVVHNRPVMRGDKVQIHTWWMRGERVVADVRISARLYDTQGRFYGAIDGPPVPETLSQANWPLDQPVLGRVTLTIPAEMPVGPAEVRLVVYDMDGSFEPFDVPVDTLEVHDSQ